MIDFSDMFESIYFTWLIWDFCRGSSLCNIPFLNLKLHITIRNEKLAKLLIYQQPFSKEIQHEMGIMGIVSHLTIIPPTIYFWLRDGKFLFITESGIEPWFGVYVFLRLMWLSLNICIGKFFQWLNQQRQEAARRKCPKITHIIWDEHTSNETEKQAEEVFLNADKIFWDYESQKMYYKCGDNLLTLTAKGEFISLTAEGYSDFVLMLMRTALCISSANQKEKN